MKLVRLLGVAMAVSAAPLAPSAHAQAPPVVLESPNAVLGGDFGASVSSVADVDGDGVSDLLIGARGETVGGVEFAGRAYVFSGATGTLLRTLVSPSPESASEFGTSASGVADVDGDGVGDLLIGAYGESVDSFGFAGRAYVFSGATGVLVRTLASPSPEPEGFFGDSVSGVADVDGDGRDDLIIGAPGETVDGIEAAGRTYVFSGATGALLRTLESPNPSGFGNFGGPVLGMPDEDGDGRGELFVTAIREASGDVGNAGRAYVFSGATGALLRTVASPNSEEIGRFGGSVSIVSDADGDSVDDLLIGAFAETVDGIEAAGRAYVFSGATGALLRTLETPNPELTGFFGISVSGVSDADGDGVGDLLVGAFVESAGGVQESGRAYVFSGATGALLRTLVSPDPEQMGWFGISVSSVPDADGDGRGDFLVGAIFEDGGASNAGRAYIFASDVSVRTEGAPDVPAFALAAPHPNPTAGPAAVAFTLATRADVRLAVFDLLGRRVAVLAEGAYEAGSYQVTWDGRVGGALAPAGLYVVRLRAGGAVASRRLVLAR